MRLDHLLPAGRFNDVGRVRVDEEDGLHFEPLGRILVRLDEGPRRVLHRQFAHHLLLAQRFQIPQFVPGQSNTSS